ncbi:YkgJ family cysteine cluster protein [Burkholderia vietnamiensis]|uniref:YkgJ family cysteine cluster protein n=1 Tax=Burkholderia vietnamiensis TaxID=60552 RepID=UPI0009C151C9|nr:YkgJ family cysteine cluster protein [Burkholderia vietnamiensis]
MNDQELEARIMVIVDDELTRCISAMSQTSNGNVRSKVMPIYKRFDNKLNGSTTKIDCKSGCDYCCYYHVTVTGAEVLALAEHINNLPAERRAILVERITATARQVSNLSAQEYVHTNIKCAMLENNRCSVYDARPRACRGFHSRDVNGCKAAFDNPNADDPNAWDPERFAVNLGYSNVLFAAQYNSGCDATTYELHAALAEALTNKSSFKRWKAGKVAFPSVKDRTSVEERVEGGPMAD